MGGWEGGGGLKHWIGRELQREPNVDTFKTHFTFLIYVCVERVDLLQTCLPRVEITTILKPTLKVTLFYLLSIIRST